MEAKLEIAGLDEIIKEVVKEELKKSLSSEPAKVEIENFIRSILG